MLVGDKLNTRTLLAVLECLKDRALHIETIYVNSLDPSRGCTLQAELIVTTSSGNDSVCNGRVWSLGNPQFHNGQLCNVYKCLFSPHTG